MAAQPRVLCGKAYAYGVTDAGTVRVEVTDYARPTSPNCPKNPTAPSPTP